MIRECVYHSTLDMNGSRNQLKSFSPPRPLGFAYVSKSVNEFLGKREVSLLISLHKFDVEIDFPFRFTLLDFKIQIKNFHSTQSLITADYRETNFHARSGN